MRLAYVYKTVWSHNPYYGQKTRASLVPIRYTSANIKTMRINYI